MPSLLERRLSAIEDKVRLRTKVPDDDEAALDRLCERLEAWRRITPEGKAAKQAADDAAYQAWRESGGEDEGGRFAFRARLEAVLLRRHSGPVTDDDSGVMTGTLVPALAGPQGDTPAANNKPLPPPRRRAKSAEEPPPRRDSRAWCRDYDQESAEASGRFFEPDAV